jgi:hypothetical protein
MSTVQVLPDSARRRPRFAVRWGFVPLKPRWRHSEILRRRPKEYTPLHGSLGPCTHEVPGGITSPKSIVAFNDVAPCARLGASREAAADGSSLLPWLKAIFNAKPPSAIHWRGTANRRRAESHFAQRQFDRVAQITCNLHTS